MISRIKVIAATAAFVLIVKLASVLYFAVFDPGGRASPYDRCRSEFKMYESALNCYYIDNDAFPASGGRFSHALHRLSTPVAYISSGNDLDIFTYRQTIIINKHGEITKRTVRDEADPLHYAVYGDRCLLWSVGADGISQIDEGIASSDIDRALRSATPYHPSNGVTSSGDMWLTIDAKKNVVTRSYDVMLID